MAFRLSDRVVRGELFNTHHYSTHGWLELRGTDRPLSLQLTGNCSPDLAGWHIRFEAKNAADENPPTFASAIIESKDEIGNLPMVSPTTSQEDEITLAESSADDDLPDYPMEAPTDSSGLAWMQIGPTGSMTADRRVRVFDCSFEEYYRRSQLDEPPPSEWKPCLYLEWFSQNGRVVLELPDPFLEFVEHVDWTNDQNVDSADVSNNSVATESEDDIDPAAEETMQSDIGLSISEIRLNDEGQAEVTEHFFPANGEDFAEDIEEKDDDPYQLFPNELQKQLDNQTYHTDWTIQGETDNGEKSESIREMELMDHLIENSDGERIDSFCHIPIPLEKLEFLSDEQVEAALKDMLSQLAMLGVALDFCKHYTPRKGYRLLIEEIFPKHHFFPELRATSWVQHYSTYEFCSECEAEFEKEYEERERRRREHPDEFPDQSA